MRLWHTVPPCYINSISTVEWAEKGYLCSIDSSWDALQNHAYTWSVICCAGVLTLVNTLQDIGWHILVTESVVYGNSTEVQWTNAIFSTADSADWELQNHTKTWSIICCSSVAGTLVDVLGPILSRRLFSLFFRQDSFPIHSSERFLSEKQDLVLQTRSM